MPKAGVIYNDVKPIAYKIAVDIKKTLTEKGWDVHLATGIGGILGYSTPDSPVCHTPIDGLTPPGFEYL